MFKISSKLDSGKGIYIARRISAFSNPEFCFFCMTKEDNRYPTVRLCSDRGILFLIGYELFMGFEPPARHLLQNAIETIEQP